MSFGKMPIANGFINKKDKDKEYLRNDRRFISRDRIVSINKFSKS